MYYVNNVCKYILGAVGKLGWWALMCCFTTLQNFKVSINYITSGFLIIKLFQHLGLSNSKLLFY